ncbi:cephalotocin receptor 1 [Plakobranchus ocellatus]|uniref:Cephalotocin receptor 1 n=1 Tax=Plakobranchus ocellatus TaxID=259542 RepID=A0AAV4DQ11_9GAST|nr:cephalotocin receptor 1 [Plakobranchus ocellatus]
MLNFWNRDQPMFCRARLWLTSVFTLMSALTLNALAVLRYRKICIPFGWQITIRQAKISSFILLMISLLCALPYGIINGRQTKLTPHPGINGSVCSIDDAFIDTIWPFLNSCFFIFFFFSSSTAMVVSYSCIGVKIWRHSRSFSRATSAGVGSSNSNSGGVTHSFSRATETTSKNSQEESDNKDPTKDTSRSHQDSFSDEEPSCSVKISTSSEIAVFSKRHLPGIICESGNEARSQRSESKRNISTIKSIETKASIRPKRSLNRTTVMLIIISAVYIIGFLPLIAMITWASANTKKHSSLQGPQLALFHLFLRSYFLNSAANPVIYGICDLSFRKECRKIFCCSRV